MRMDTPGMIKAAGAPALKCPTRAVVPPGMGWRLLHRQQSGNHGVREGHTEFHGAFRGQHPDWPPGSPGRFRRFAQSAILPFSVDLRVTLVNSVFTCLPDREAGTGGG
jgi:hypothetical protein